MRTETNIKFINHSSVLIQYEQNFVLTDPWYDKPAFGSWLPNPPSSVHPAYLVALSQSTVNFTIAISHGHDDHLDDLFLSLFPKNINILIPKYKSVGLLKRLKRIGFVNIFQADEDGIQIGCFQFKSYINPKICPDDSILTIKSKNMFVVHANDNWQKIETQHLQKIRKDCSLVDNDKTLYMSQCNLADGWPALYKDYSDAEKQNLHTKRIRNIIQNALCNGEAAGCKNFLNYAGHASAFVKGEEHLETSISYTTNSYIKNFAREYGFSIKVLEMIPGDIFNFKNVIQQFPGINLNNNNLKNASRNFYKVCGVVDRCDTYQKIQDKTYDYSKNLKIFLNNFNSFVLNRVGYTNFNSDIVGFKIVIRSKNIVEEVIIGQRNSDSTKTAIFEVSENMLYKLLNGDINWENLYIGFQSTVKTVPEKINIRAPVRWLASYGYVYQRDVKNGK